MNISPTSIYNNKSQNSSCKKSFGIYRATESDFVTINLLLRKLPPDVSNNLKARSLLDYVTEFYGQRSHQAKQVKMSELFGGHSEDFHYYITQQDEKNIMSLPEAERFEFIEENLPKAKKSSAFKVLNQVFSWAKSDEKEKARIESELQLSLVG